MSEKAKEKLWLITICGSILCLFLLSQNGKKRIEYLFSKEENYIVVPAQVIKRNRYRGNSSYTVRYKAGKEMIESRLYNTAGLAIGSTVLIR
jgi:hypothetical protein